MKDVEAQAREKGNGMRRVGAVAAVAFAGALGLHSCSTEVDLTADYQSIPVVYGLLEVEADTQWVKINRTWLGEGNQLEAAQVRDSSEFAAGALVASIHELFPSGTGQILGNEEPTGRVWALRDTVVATKEEGGVFFAPEQRVYFAETRDGGFGSLRDDRLYRLEATLPDGTEISAVTSMVESIVGGINYPPSGANLQGFPLGFATVNNGVPNYGQIPFNWDVSPGASLYAASLDVHFTERHYGDDAMTLLDSVRSRTISIPLGTRDVSTISDFAQVEVTFSGERFYTELASRLTPNPRVRRVLGVYNEAVQKEFAFDFVLQVANQDLAIYLDVNETTNSIVQDRPLWTNIEGGIGLWGSRSRVAVDNLGYTKQTIQHLQEGDLTAALNFCSPSPISDFGCD